MCGEVGAEAMNTNDASIAKAIHRIKRPLRPTICGGVPVFIHKDVPPGEVWFSADVAARLESFHIHIAAVNSPAEIRIWGP